LSKTKWAVDIIESERGWGQKVDETKIFDDYDEALEFRREYNEKYNSDPVVPDWYMMASEPYPVNP